MKLKLIIPAGVLLLGALTACSSPAAPTADAQAPAAAGQAQDSGGQTQAAEDKDEKEEPLTGELKEKAEAAALAKFPGTVKKSEFDAEKPGNYAVEIEQDKGGTVEVYVNKSFKVIGTKDEKDETDKD